MESSTPNLTSEESRNWLELPRDVMSTILLKLGAIEILTNAQYVCTLWRKICKDPTMWRSIDMHNSWDLWNVDYDLETMARHAVDRSCGELVDINIEDFCTDKLLKYISDRFCRLRRLRLVCCYNISDEGLSEWAAKNPSLEDLELSYCSISQEALEAVGRSCPMLKSLKLNNQGFRRPHIESDEEALAIAANMPELRHLQLFGNKLTNDGLKAILDSCPHLESLDLRQCFNVNLTGNMGKRCAEQIKNLRCTNDPTDDYKFNAEIHDFDGSSDSFGGGFAAGSPTGFLDMGLLSDDYDYDYDDYDDFTDPFNFSDDEYGVF